MKNDESSTFLALCEVNLSVTMCLLKWCHHEFLFLYIYEKKKRFLDIEWNQWFWVLATRSREEPKKHFNTSLHMTVSLLLPNLKFAPPPKKKKKTTTAWTNMIRRFICNFSHFGCGYYVWPEMKRTLVVAWGCWIKVLCQIVYATCQKYLTVTINAVIVTVV